MRITTFQSIVAAGFLCIAAQAAHGADWETRFFTNETVVANSRTVISALHFGNTQDETRALALVGSQVAFFGFGSPPPNHTPNLLLSSNIVLDVEILPAEDARRSNYAVPYYMRDMRGVYSAEVLGTLKSVDFEKRVIHIQAKSEDWMLGPVF